MKTLILKSFLGLLVTGGLVTGAVLIPKKDHTTPQPTVSGQTIEAPASDPVTEPKAETPPQPSPKSSKVQVSDLVVVPTPEEVAFQVDQNTIKNVEQDAKLEEHENKINELQNQVNNLPIYSTPYATPQPAYETPYQTPIPVKSTFHFPSNFVKSVSDSGDHTYFGFNRSSLSDEQIRSIKIQVIRADGQTIQITNPSISYDQFWYELPNSFRTNNTRYNYTLTISTDNLEGIFNNYFATGTY